MMPDPIENEWNASLRDLEPVRERWENLELSFSARRAAQAMGFNGSAAFHGWLTTHGLPSYFVIRNWYYVAVLADRFHNTSLAQWALESDRDPAIYYRFVSRVTGLPWKEIQKRGARWVKARALEIWRPYRGTA